VCWAHDKQHTHRQTRRNARQHAHMLLAACRMPSYVPPDCSLLCTSAMIACSARWQPSSRYLQQAMDTGPAHHVHASMDSKETVAPAQHCASSHDSTACAAS
jgi:hypothetical protein